MKTNIDIRNNIYQEHFDPDGINDLFSKTAAMLTLATILAAPPKIHAITYTQKQLLEKVNEYEADNCIELKEYDFKSYAFDNFQIISKKIETEFSNYSNNIWVDIKEAKLESKLLAKKISKINFNKIAVELTPSNAIKFTLTFKDNKLLMLTSPFDEIEGMSKGEVLFSFFIDRKLILSDTINIDDLVSGINNYTLA